MYVVDLKAFDDSYIIYHECMIWCSNKILKYLIF